MKCSEHTAKTQIIIELYKLQVYMAGAVQMTVFSALAPSRISSFQLLETERGSTFLKL